MSLATLALAQAVPRFSSSYALLFVLLFAAGTVGWLVAAVLGFTRAPSARPHTAPAGFVTTRGTRFLLEGHAFRFVGANVAVMYKDEDRAQMPETLRQAALHGVRVVRVWASGEGTEETGVLSVGTD